jgi:hypothetical protein
MGELTQGWMLQMDAKTLLASTMSMLCVLAGIVYSQRLTLEAKAREIRMFAIGCAGFAAGGSLWALRGSIDPLLSITLGNALLAYAIFLCKGALSGFFKADFKRSLASWAGVAAAARHDKRALAFVRRIRGLRLVGCGGLGGFCLGRARLGRAAIPRGRQGPHCGLGIGGNAVGCRIPLGHRGRPARALGALGDP